MKILHVFDHSLPHHSGYAFRSAAILGAQHERGIETIHLTSPKHDHDGQLLQEVDGLRFERCPEVITGSSARAQVQCVRALRRKAREMVIRERPDVIHAHSPCLNGLAVLGLGVPVVYEVRACWEDAAVSSGTTAEGSIRYRASRALETFVARQADHLVVICQGLADEFSRRGIPAAKISMIGNAVNPVRLPKVNAARATALRKRLGLKGRRIIGFFGSFYDYEGLELLVRALPAVLESEPDACLMLAGGGEAETRLRSCAASLHLENAVRFLGRIPHDDIGDCYGAADVMVFPRLKQTLTDMVTPLKPLEANYLGVPVVASDVGGHLELIRNGDTGLLFPAGDAQALANALVRVLAEPTLAERLVRGGQELVRSERLWSHMAERYAAIYSSMADTPMATSG